MDDKEKNLIYNTLLSMQAQIQSLFYLLGAADNDSLDDIEKIQSNCHHPENERKVYTTMGSPEHWVCKVCGFEYKEDLKEREG